MFRKFCFRKQAAGGFRRRGPTRRAFARCVRCRCTGFFSAVGRACLARHGAALIVGLAAPRRPRRQPRRLQLLVLGLRLPAASCLVGVALQPHIVAAWRRPPRGAPAGPRCPGRMRSGRPFKVADACCGLVHAHAAALPPASTASEASRGPFCVCEIEFPCPITSRVCHERTYQK